MGKKTETQLRTHAAEGQPIWALIWFKKQRSDLRSLKRSLKYQMKPSCWSPIAWWSSCMLPSKRKCNQIRLAFDRKIKIEHLSMILFMKKQMKWDHFSKKFNSREVWQCWITYSRGAISTNSEIIRNSRSTLKKQPMDFGSLMRLRAFNSALKRLDNTSSGRTSRSHWISGRTKRK